MRQDDSYFSTKPVQATKVMVSVDISRLQGEFGIRDYYFEHGAPRSEGEAFCWLEIDGHET